MRHPEDQPDARSHRDADDQRFGKEAVADRRFGCGREQFAQGLARFEEVPDWQAAVQDFAAPRDVHEMVVDGFAGEEDLVDSAGGRQNGREGDEGETVGETHA